MALIRINWKPDIKERRKFGVAMLVGFGLIALIFYLKKDVRAAVACLGFGLVSGVLGLSGTAIVLPVYWLWMSIAFVMGNIMSRVILTLFYYVIITPIAIAMRLRGRDKLNLRGKAESYWIDTKDEAPDYERQF